MLLPTKKFLRRPNWEREECKCLPSHVTTLRRAVQKRTNWFLLARATRWETHPAVLHCDKTGCSSGARERRRKGRRSVVSPIYSTCFRRRRSHPTTRTPSFFANQLPPADHLTCHAPETAQMQHTPLVNSLHARLDCRQKLSQYLRTADTCELVVRNFIQAIELQYSATNTRFWGGLFDLKRSVRSTQIFLQWYNLRRGALMSEAMVVVGSCGLTLKSTITFGVHQISCLSLIGQLVKIE